MKIRPVISRLLASTLLLSACALAADEQGHFIIYLEPGTAAQVQSSEAQAALLARWAKALDGTVHLERTLATGGWVVTVQSPGDASRQMRAVEQLPGVDTVERDAILRHQ